MPKGLYYKFEDCAGKTYGTWTVIGTNFVPGASTNKYVLCRCECGVEKIISVSDLFTGKTGNRCVHINPRYRSIKGKKFDSLLVLDDTGVDSSRRRIAKCLCDCGNIHYVQASTLLRGESTNCGCQTKLAKSYNFTNMRFGHLVAKYKIDRKNAGLFAIWHCQCDCGNTIELESRQLTSGERTNCGCLHNYYLNRFANSYKNKDEMDRKAVLGCVGVCFDKQRNKYMSVIKFNNKAYTLKACKTVDEAIAARRLGEEKLYKPIIEYYEKWLAKGDQDPKWARENPIKIEVTRKKGIDFDIKFTPEL